MLNYTISALTVNQIEQHLQECTGMDFGMLIHDYAEKIHSHATTIALYQDTHLVGLCACYMNDFATKTAYITHIAISPLYRGRGYGKQLLEYTLQLAKTNGFDQLNLEVAKNNTPAQNLYLSHGFNLLADRNTKLLLQKVL